MYEGNSFYTEYKKHEVRTEIRIKSDGNITLPTVTVCHSLQVVGRQYIGFITEINCYKNLSIFRDESCKDVRHRIHFGSRPHIKRHPEFPSCVIINPLGHVTTASDAVQDTYKIYWRDDSILYTYLYLYTHDPSDLPFSLASPFVGSFAINSKGAYKLDIIDKKVTHRLKTPLPSNFTNGESTNNIFPGRYTLKKCQDTCTFKHMLRECGTVVDHWRKYVLGRPLINKTLEIAAPCLKSISRRKMNATICQCQFSCLETTYDTIIRKTHETPYSYMAEINIVYEKNTFTLVKEYEAYPLNKFFTDIGGWCGLFVGMSFLSLIEIIVFILLTIVALCRKHVNSKNKRYKVSIS